MYIFFTFIAYFTKPWKLKLHQKNYFEPYFLKESQNNFSIPNVCRLNAKHFKVILLAAAPCCLLIVSF